MSNPKWVLSPFIDLIRRLATRLYRTQFEWRFVGAPNGSTDVRRLLVDPRDDTLWYVSTHSHGLFVTRDGGTTWEHPLSGNVGAMALDPTNADVVYGSSGTSVYRSTNRGEEWCQLYSLPNSESFIDSLLVATSQTDIYLGASNAQRNARIYRSPDGGTTWDISFDSGPRGLNIWDIAEDPINGYLYFCTEDSAFHDPSPVMRSVNRGESWDDIAPPSGPHCLNVKVDPATHVVYLLTESRWLYESTNFGASWSTSSQVPFGAVLLIDRNLPTRFVGGEMTAAGRAGGVYLSENAGESFRSGGLIGSYVMSLALNGTSTLLFAAAYGQGIHRRSI